MFEFIKKFYKNNGDESSIIIEDEEFLRSCLGIFIERRTIQENALFMFSHMNSIFEILYSTGYYPLDWFKDEISKAYTYMIVRKEGNEEWVELNKEKLRWLFFFKEYDAIQKIDEIVEEIAKYTIYGKPGYRRIDIDELKNIEEK